MADGTTNENAQSVEAGTRRTVFIIVGVLTALLLAVVFYLATRPATSVAEPRLESAIRPGDPAFDSLREQLLLDGVEADQSPRAVGDIVMTLRGTVRNFTGRTIDGLEVRAAVVDSAGNPVRERTVIVLPSTRATELGTNKTLPVAVRLEGFKQSDDRANIRMEIAGVKFK